VQLRPDAVVVPVAGSGHYLILSAPERVSALIEGFLETVSVATQPS
jgi:pimeloyl-ACP methyl ester carboxylesterase